MSKDMCSRNRPKSNTESRLAPNGRGPAGDRSGAALESTALRLPRASRSALRRLFAPGTPASAAVVPGRSGGLPTDVAELVAPPERPRHAAGGVAVEVAAAAPAAGFETEASSHLAARPDVEPDAQPARRGHRRVSRRVDVPADVARANPCTPPPGGPFSVWR